MEDRCSSLFSFAFLGFACALVDFEEDPLLASWDCVESSASFSKCGTFLLSLRITGSEEKASATQWDRVGRDGKPNATFHPLPSQGERYEAWLPRDVMYIIYTLSI